MTTHDKGITSRFLQAGTSAQNRTVQDKLRDVVSVFDFMTPAQIADVQARTLLVDVTSAIQAAIDALTVSGGGKLLFPAGTYLHATQLQFKNKIEYIGDGYYASRLHYTGTSDQVIVSNPVNSSTVANIHVQGIYFYGPNISSVGAMRGNFFDTGSSLITWDRCFFECPQVGLILDQTELATVRECYMAGGKAGAWLVAGTDRNAGASAFYTNRIKFDGCQFNGSGAYIGIVDDGGVAHDIVSCNFNAGATYVRACQVSGLNFRGGEYEVCTGPGINLVLTKWQSGIAALRCETVLLEGGFWFHSGTNECVAVAAAGCGSLTFNSHTLQTNSTSVISGADNCDTLLAKGNIQVGSGEGYLAPNKINNFYGPVSGSVTWTAATTNPVLGNGTLISNISRAGRRVTVTVSLTIGSTTTLGSGNWLFSLPVTATSINDIGNAFYVCAGGLYCGIARCNQPAGKITLFSASSTANAVQSSIPAAWANGNSLEFTATYTAANKLG